MSFLYNNIAVLVVVAVVSTLGWLYGGARGDLLVPVVPWLFVLLLETIICFPQRHHGETTYEARARVWYALGRSPFVWVSFGFLVLLMIPLINAGLCTGCDAALIAQGYDPNPPIPYLPSCVNRQDHLSVVLWFAVVLPSAITVRYCLTRRGKRLTVELIVWNGVAMAIFGFIQGALGAPGPFWGKSVNIWGNTSYFFSTFGYPNMAGAYFTALFGLAMALWRDRYEQIRLEERGQDPTELSGSEAKRYGRFWRRHYFLMPAVVLFFAALNTLSRAAIILVTTTAIVYFAHTLVVTLSRFRRSRRMFVGVWSMVIFGLIIFFATIFMPEKMKHEVGSLGTSAVLDRVTGKGQYHVQVATSIWADHPLFGIGGWGYAHFCADKMNELGIPLKNLQIDGGANVHNDHLQFLMEHGLVGFGMLVALLAFLIHPIICQWRAMIHDLRFKKGGSLPPKPIQIFALPAASFFMLVSVSAVMIHAFGDCPLRSCAILALIFVSFAAIPGFMPRSEHHHSS